MIVACKDLRQIGQIVSIPIFINDVNGRKIEEIPAQPCMVVRRATFEEWVNDCIAACGPPPSDLKDEGYFYYEIESD